MMRKTLYFGYGSNLWRDQMHTRCPDSKFLGIGRLKDYDWIISERGYANVVPVEESTTTTKHEVWGLVYSLSADDEARLDVNEGVPKAYQKKELSCDFWAAPDDDPELKTFLVYVSKDHITKSKPKKEYIYRMNMGIKDAVKAGVPKAYVKDVLRKFIPAEDDETVREVAEQQAFRFKDER